jgi:hypothetical protein
VRFWDGSGFGAVASPPAACATGTSWTATQIIVELPMAARTGAIQVTNASSSLSDLTNDTNGPVLDNFTVNGVARPGLSYGIFDTSVGQSMTALVALSMVTAPVLIGAFVKWILPLFIVNRDNRDSDVIDEHDAPVIVAGFGRFGQMVTRLLRSVGFQVTVLEHNADQVEVLRRFGLKSFFGDASRYDLLRSAGIDNAKLLAITIDDKEKAVEILKEVKEKHPHLPCERDVCRTQKYHLSVLGFGRWRFWRVSVQLLCWWRYWWWRWRIANWRYGADCRPVSDHYDWRCGSGSKRLHRWQCGRRHYDQFPSQHYRKGWERWSYDRHLDDYKRWCWRNWWNGGDIFSGWRSWGYVYPDLRH